MRKIFLTTFLMMLSFLLFACIADPDKNKDNPDHTYATVRMLFFYQESTIDDWKDDYHKKKSWSYDELKSYTSTNSIVITYKNKDNLVKDYPKIVESLSYTPEIYLELYSLAEEIKVSDVLTKEELITITDKYDQTEIHFDLLDYEELYVSMDESYINGTLIIDSNEKLATLYEELPITIEPNFFDTKALIIVGGYRSGSLIVYGVDSVFYLNETTLEVAINGELASNVVTSDERYYTLILSVDQTILTPVNRVIQHFHITHLDGFRRDVPFHNTLNPWPNQNYQEMGLYLPGQRIYLQGDELNFWDLEIYIKTDENEYLHPGRYYYKTPVDTNIVGTHTIYVLYNGFMKSFSIEVLPEIEDVKLLYSNRPTVVDEAINDGFIEDYETYVALNVDLELEASFFEDSILYLKRFESSNTNLFRILTQAEVSNNKLLLHIYKPPYSAGEAITAGQLIFSISKEIRNQVDDVTFVFNRNLI
ncbi:hypothetical protein [Acholeplasma granularum]|uniref:hypothetical protein n=1 Tax=Acholeplasma granularum TaxID=264635 RepID=UPI000471A167|nr:hypothetical protein [Acholeplasma granularum]